MNDLGVIKWLIIYDFLLLLAGVAFIGVNLDYSLNATSQNITIDTQISPQDSGFPVTDITYENPGFLDGVSGMTYTIFTFIFIILPNVLLLILIAKFARGINT